MYKDVYHSSVAAEKRGHLSFEVPPSGDKPWLPSSKFGTAAHPTKYNLLVNTNVSNTLAYTDLHCQLYPQITVVKNE